MRQLHHRPGVQGFSLLELMVVLVLVGVMVGMVSIGTGATPQRLMADEGQRLAVVLSAAREEAQVRSLPVRLVVDASGYRFLARGQEGWVLIENDELLRPRLWRAPVRQARVLSADGADFVEFGREAVDQPFRVEIRGDQALGVLVVTGDGLGGFEVQ